MIIDHPSRDLAIDTITANEFSDGVLHDHKLLASCASASWMTSTVVIELSLEAFRGTVQNASRMLADLHRDKSWRLASTFLQVIHARLAMIIEINKGSKSDTKMIPVSIKSTSTTQR